MKIAVLSSHTVSLFWFRMDMMKDFVKRGYTVIALGPEPEIEWKIRFKENNTEYKQVFVERNGISPIRDLRTLKELYRFMRSEKPDKVFSYQAKTVIYGSLAARLNGIREFYPLIAGLGSIFRGNGLKNAIIKTIMKAQYRIALRFSEKAFFQNNDDKNEFIKNGLIEERKTVIINGSGVNLEKFRPEPLPELPAFLFIGRLIKDKGIMEYLEACKRVKEKYKNVRCLLVGPYDENPSALRMEELKPYIDNGIVEYFGEQTDVRPFIAQCSTYILPSYHEGTPKSVLEAMAMGRPIITTDAPGCRETVVDNVNGYLVKVKDVGGLTEKMFLMIENYSRLNEMGAKSILICKEKYDVNKVNEEILRYMGL